MQIESQPKVLLQQKQLVVNARTAAYQDIQTKLYTLKTAADDLRSLTLFNGSPYTSSSDTTRLTAAATSNASPGTYDVNVTRMAAANVKQQQATSFTSSFGYAYAGAAPTPPRAPSHDLTDASGTSLGLAKGQTITLQSTKNGTAQTPATFTVTDTTTLEDLRSFVQTNLVGLDGDARPGRQDADHEPAGRRAGLHRRLAARPGRHGPRRRGRCRHHRSAGPDRLARLGAWCTAAATSTSRRRGSRSTSR